MQVLVARQVLKAVVRIVSGIQRVYLESVEVVGVNEVSNLTSALSAILGRRV